MRIGVFCSGGDAPGMNPCIRAIVRSAIGRGHEVVGIYRGYQGLLDEEFYVNAQGENRMTLRSVSNLSMRGGTVLFSSRCPRFREDEGQKQAAETLRRHGIDALIPIGGNGTFRGAIDLARHWEGRIVGCPGTIDNDLRGTDFTIGFATAVHTAVDAVDKLRDTAASHDRMFIVEVMGRHSGYIALYTAIAAGVEVVCIPETPTDVPQIVAHLNVLRTRGKKSIMMVVAEGEEEGGAELLNERLIQAGCLFPTRVVKLGHLQRGGVPAPMDRILATVLGDFAVCAVLEGKTGVMAGRIGHDLTLTPLEECVEGHKELPPNLLGLLDTMAV